MINVNVDDKYEVIRILQQSAATAVFLVKHKKIGAFRILKAISKASPDASSILSETNLLQGFNSPCLPTIYEVEETDEVYYLIEEYIDGISLREYLYSTKLNREELLKIAIELCSIVEILHTEGNEPVLYRDMKPEHVILQNEGLKLIDFGISIKKSEGKNAKPLGTPNWAAPEQLSGGRLDERCDVYGVGKIIEFMLGNSYGKEDYKIRHLVDKATSENVELRIESISILKEQLQSLLESNNNNKTGKEHLEKTIAVVGAGDAVGTTHIAISLCKFFNKRKIEVYYRDIRKNTVNELWKNLKGVKLKEGVLYHKDFRGIMNYGDAIKYYKPPKGLYILDCGKEVSDVIVNVDTIIYVLGGAPWQKDMILPPWIKDKNVYIVINFSNKITSIKKAKELGKIVYMYPTVKRTLGLSKDEERVFSAIFKNEKDYM